MTPQELLAEAKSQITEINCAQADEMLERSVVFVDVRESTEYDESHIPGALLLPRGVLEFRAYDHPILKDRDAEYVFYCRSGARSAMAARNMKRIGYSKGYSMAGGILAWIEEGREIEK